MNIFRLFYHFSCSYS